MDQPVNWKRRVTVSVLANDTPIPFTLVRELDGVVVRCGNCGLVAASLRRKDRLWGRSTYYTHCRTCGEEDRLGGRLGAAERLEEVDPHLAEAALRE